MKNFYQFFFILSFTSLILPGQSLIAGETLKKFEQELQSLIESNKTSIVTVTSHFSHEISVEKQNGFLSFFKTDIQKKEWSFINVGTGLIFDKDGHIITKSSIVIGSEIHNVTFADGFVLTAKLIGHDPETGFAVIKLEPNEISLIPVKIGNCEGIMPGSWNFILGNSLGVYPSVVFGSVNAIRSDGMIQLSANLNPGNNGSPIINLKGEIIGLVAGQLQSSSETLVNFAELNPTTLAYPINWIQKIAEDIIKYGHVVKGWLGVVGYYDGQQPKISEIKSNSPAQNAGLSKGDIILKYSNEKVKNITQLARLVEYTPPGEIVKLEFIRKNKILSTDVKIGEKIQNNISSDSLNTDLKVNVEYVDLENQDGQEQNYSVFERNRLITERIKYLEKEVAKLKSIIETN